MERPIARLQETTHLPGISITARGRHRYEGLSAESPAEVGLSLQIYQPDDSPLPGPPLPRLSVRVDLTPIAALKLAAALTELAGKAVAWPPTDDNVPEPAAPVEVDPPEVR
jgi:hypothetical protein